MTDRPAHPTIAQIREISQPISVTGRSNAEHWVADLYLRKISPYLTRLLLKTPITANGVTYLMILTGLRWRNTQSPKGVFLDRVGHYLTESLIPIALSMRIIGWPDKEIADWKLPFLAALISILILLNKGFNDIVHVSRAFGGLTKLSDSKESGAAVKSWLRVVKAPFKVLAVQRLFHSVEMTIVIALLSASESIVIALLSASELLITYGLYVALFVTFGHLVAILGSRKLDPR